jgi:ParB-like chromosome segregation protein Spo0J
MAKVEDLVPYAKKAKKHPPGQIKKLAKMIEEFGFLQPVLVDKDGVIVVGHGRVMAAHQLGIEEVPCKRLEHLTEEQIKAYRIADNKISESGWVEEALIEELRELQVLDESYLELTGFDEKEIGELLAAMPIEDEDPGPVGVPQKDPNVLVRLSFHPGTWLGKREEIKGVLERMEKAYGCTVRIEE